jgi:hypothetical protein
LSAAALVPSASPTVIKVAAVSASHVYVRHPSDPDGNEAVLRLPDPAPTGR